MEKDSKETYLHHLAKQTFITWLREVAQDGSASLGEISWRVNRDAPSYGVYDEYPMNKGFSTVWDENGFQEHTYPDYKYMVKHYGRNFKIADIAIQHKGMIAYVIEIVHKNHMTQQKIDFYYNLLLRPTLYEISAQWILGQVERPTEIPREFCIY